MFHHFSKKWDIHKHHEPFYENLSRIFWATNGGIVIIHWIVAIWLSTDLLSHNMPELASQAVLIPGFSVLVFLGMSLLYQYPQYSSIPYSLLLEELPKRRQEQLRYIFHQLIVTSTAYLLVFFLTVQIHVAADLLGISVGIFIAIYALLALVLVSKFFFATWYIRATR